MKGSFMHRMLWVVMATFAIVIAGCSDSNYDPQSAFDLGKAYNPNKPIKVGQISPTTASQGSQVLIYGDNMGNDTSRIRLYLGGEKAVVIRSLGDAMLAIVPPQAYDNDDYSSSIKVEQVDTLGDVVASAVSDSLFHYIPKLLSSNYLGEKYENNTKYDIKDGPFDDCGGFERLLWFCFDPLDPDMLYCAGETHGFRYFDFKNKYVGTLSLTGIPNKNIQSVTFTLRGDLIVANYQNSDQAIGVYMLTRESDFKETHELVQARQVQSVCTHPENGRVYYTLTGLGEVWSVDPYNPEDIRREQKMVRSGTGYNIVWHPTGDYCYITQFDRHTIWRADYNHDTEELGLPYTVAGTDNAGGWVDGVGTTVRLWKPWQGFFLKNPEYAGQEDEYDYYFSDNRNQCIRFLTPMGRVETYAGHIDNGNKDFRGLRNGDLRTETLFFWPEAFVYDAKRNQMLVGDTGNNIIRRLGSEEKSK